jgi:hypothetical protein
MSANREYNIANMGVFTWILSRIYKYSKADFHLGILELFEMCL